MSTFETMTDEELAVAYMDGSNRAFDELLSRSQDKIFGYIIYIVKDDDLANDLFQETFLKLITKLRDGHYTNSGKFIWWAMRIAHNVIIDHSRAVKSSKILDQGDDNDLSNLRGSTMLESNRESELANAQVLRDVRRMMDNLPETQREVVFMRFYQNLSFKEIAEQTNVSINTSLGRMRYALMNMRKMSKQYRVNLAIDL
jgi:RNA polymerase sigma-70 factor (ECF subfamily)